MSVIIIAAIIFSVTILISTAAICLTAIGLDKSQEYRRAAVDCLEELVDVLNEKFPGSDLKIIDTRLSIKVKGELKYKI